MRRDGSFIPPADRIGGFVIVGMTWAQPNPSVPGKSPRHRVACRAAHSIEIMRSEIQNTPSEPMV
jgi:hypothetical protein